MELIQELFRIINELYTKICIIEESLKMSDLPVTYRYCNIDEFNNPFIENNTFVISAPRLLHDTIKVLLDKVASTNDVNQCIIPTIYVRLALLDERRLVRCKTVEVENPENPQEKTRIQQCKVVVPDVQDIEIKGVKKASKLEDFYKEFITTILSSIEKTVNYFLVYRYGKKNSQGNYIGIDNKPIQTTDIKSLTAEQVALDISQSVQDCYNNLWFIILNKLNVTVPLIEAQMYYMDAYSDFLEAIACIQESQGSGNCVPVFYGEIREKYKYLPQLHLVFELDPKPTNPRELRRTEMVIPFPDTKKLLDSSFDPAVFKDAKRTIGTIYAQVRWKNFHPIDETTAGFFDTEDNAIEFFEKYIFPYCKLEPITDKEDSKKKIALTKIIKREKRLTVGRKFRVSRLIYLDFDQDGFGVNCREWVVPK